MKTTVFFTQLLLDGIAPKRKEHALYDAQCTGLALRVHPGGAKSWVVWIRDHKNTRRVTLGTYEALTLEAARHQARSCLNGSPPRPALAAKTSITFKDLADRFLTAKQPVYAAETLQVATSYLKTQLVPCRSPASQHLMWPVGSMNIPEHDRGVPIKPLDILQP